MARVVCEITTATSPINGVEYTGEPGALLSAEMPDEDAASLCTIPGFRMAVPAPVASGSKGKAPKSGEAPA